MDTFGDRIRKFREDLGLGQRTFGTLIGTTGATISNWETAKTNPKKIERDLLDTAALKLGTTVQYLLEGHDPAYTPSRVRVETEGVREMSDEEDFDPSTGVMVPVYDIDVSAGPGAPVPEYVETRHKIHFQRSWLKRNRVAAEQIRVVKVRGASMQPTLFDGDMVVIHTGQTRIRNEKVFAIAYNGEMRVKRLYLMADGRLRIVSDNKDKELYPDEYLEGEELNSVTVLGQIIHKQGTGGL